MAVQTSFPAAQSAAFAGMKADIGPDYVRSYLNSASAALPFGVLVKPKSGDEGDACDAFSSGAVPLGVTLHTHAYEQADLAGALGVGVGDMANAMRQGRCWVLVDSAVTAGQSAYARHTANGAKDVKGRFRADNDGVAQVTTVTPTSANSTKFSLHIYAGGKLWSFATTSDTASSATEICDAFRTLMAADSAFSALIAATGTATLILTGQDAGAAFQVVDGGSAGAYASITTGTAASVKADAVPGCKFLTSASDGGLAILEVQLP